MLKFDYQEQNDVKMIIIQKSTKLTVLNMLYLNVTKILFNFFNEVKEFHRC